MLRTFCVCFFFFKQKTAYEMRISDWSSYVCSSDLTKTMNTNTFDHIQDPIVRAEALRAKAMADGIIASFDGLRKLVAAVQAKIRSEERRVGKECVSTCRYRWSPAH